MAYNKKEHLRRNIEAVKEAFMLDRENRGPTPEEREVLAGYSGFGAIKEALNSPDTPLDKWPKPDRAMHPLIAELHDELKKGATEACPYRRMADGIKNSTMTAFYTPPVIVGALAKALEDHGIKAGKILDPSAGMGVFADTLTEDNPDARVLNYEKDPLTARILAHLRPRDTNIPMGFETIDNRYLGYFDLAASNIPFGDVQIFDPAFSTSREPARRQGTRTLHNYFFMKSVDMVREGGIVAFITSQGVLNSPRNQPVREWLMDNCYLVSAVRFPNNLFTDHAGTEVGSDLIVLQKRTGGESRTGRRDAFVLTSELSDGIMVNNLFHNTDRVILTDGKIDTDPYGHPAVVYTHSGGVDGIAHDLRGMLQQDFAHLLDKELYLNNGFPNAPEIAIRQPQQAPVIDTVAEVMEPELAPETPVAEPEPEYTVVESVMNREPTPRVGPDALWDDDRGPLWKATPEDWQRFNVWAAERLEATMQYSAGNPPSEQQWTDFMASGAAPEMPELPEGYSLDMDTGELFGPDDPQPEMAATDVEEPLMVERYTLNLEHGTYSGPEEIDLTKEDAQGNVPENETFNDLLRQSPDFDTSPFSDQLAEHLASQYGDDFPPTEDEETQEEVHADWKQLEPDSPDLTDNPYDDVFSRSPIEDPDIFGQELEEHFAANPPGPEHKAAITEEVEPAPVAHEETAPATTEPERSVASSGFQADLFDMISPDVVPRPAVPDPAPTVSVNQEPILTLYDLFGFSEEERSQVRRPRKRGPKKAAKAKTDAVQQPLDWREKMQRDREQQEKEQAEPKAASQQPRAEQPGQTEDNRIYVRDPRVPPIFDEREEKRLENIRILEERQRQEAQKRSEDEKRAESDREQELADERQREEYLKPVPYKGEMQNHYREGIIISYDGDRIGYLRNIEGLQPMFHPLDISEAQETKLSIYTEIRDTYYHLYRNEAERLEANPALREMLNRLYDNFTERYGHLNDRKNLDVIKMDARGTEILSLEKYIDGVAHKVDIFDHPVAFNPNEITSTEDAKEALVATLNKYGRVDLDYMSSLSGMSRDAILEELAGQIHYNPMEDEYQIAARFITGNVIDKAEQVEAFLAENPGYGPAEESLRALREAVPTPVPFDDLDFNFGERWIPKSIYERFASQLFDTEVKIGYTANIDEFSVKADRRNALILTQYAVDGESRKYNGLHLMKHALQNTTPDITKKVPMRVDGQMVDVKVPDYESIQLANSRIDEIRGAFVEWLNEQPSEFKDRLADTYNRKFNCFVRPKYDGSHQQFPGLDLKGLGIPDLYESQKDAVWMDVLQGGGIIDHEVGGGKSLIMCVSAMEKKRLGLINKPVITGLKANIHEIARTFCTAYPNAKVLYPGKDDFTPKKRQEIFRQMKNNDWDAVILTHDQFGKIPQSPELQQRILWDELNSVEENLEVLRGQGKDVSRSLIKGCIRRKANLEAKLKKVMHQIESRKDDEVDFAQMGIDHIYVDESHKFKNLTFNTRHDRVAGLGNPEGSQRALNMLFAIRTIQERTGRDLGATFLSGTTISNSLTELYLLFKYLRPQEMARLDMNTFDAWAAVFAKKSIDYEFNVTGEIKPKERFRFFIKVPELAQLYSEITDYRSAEDIGIDRPAKNERLYNIPPTPDQEMFTARLVQFARSGDGRLLYRALLTDNEMAAKMLIATGYSAKMSLDMRLVDPDRFDDHVDNKASHAAKKIADYYYKYDEHKGTQFVFCDLGTYKPGDNFNIYSEVKRKLVEDHGIPAAEVRFIQESADSERKRKGMIEDMKNGHIRVMFGSTEMLGTGVNAQKRCVAIHHLDCPWRPSDLEQRDGRGIRTGNEVAKFYADNKVDVWLYAVERTLDAYKFNLLHNKQLFIRQLKTNNLGARTIDEGAIDESAGMNFSEYVAILSGNTDLLEKARLDKRIATLESEHKAFQKGRSNNKYMLDSVLESVGKKDDLIKRLSIDLENFKSRVQLNEDGSYKNLLQLDGVDGGGLEFIGKHLNHIAKQDYTGQDHPKVGSIYGFDIVVQTEKSKKSGEDWAIQTRFYVRGEGNYLYSFNNGIIATDPKLASQNFINALGTIEALVDKHTKEKEKMEVDLPVLRESAEGVWRKDGELAALREDLKELEKRLVLNLKPIEQMAVDSPQDVPDRSYFEDLPGHTRAAIGDALGMAGMLPANGRGVTVDPDDDPDDYFDDDMDYEPPPRVPDAPATRQAQEPQRTPEAPQNSPPGSFPSRLREIRDASGGRIVLGGVPSYKKDDEPDKGRKI